MGIMEEFRDAEATWTEGLSVAQEIAGLGRDFLGRVKQQRDDLKAASEALLGGIGGVVATMKAATAPADLPAPPAPSDPIPPAPAPADEVPAAPEDKPPNWNALHDQAAKLPG